MALLVLTSCAAPALFGAETAKTNHAELRYEAPKSLSAAVYAKDSNRKTLLFNFKRNAVRSGSNLDVAREFTYPDGRPAVRQHVIYQGNDLVSCQIEEIQNGGSGNARIRRDPAQPAKGVVTFEYRKDAASKPKTNEESLQNDTLVDDMIGPFIAAHWGALLNGQSVKCRYLSVPRRETVGFTFVKDSLSNWQGQPAVVIRMEPTSIIIKALVDPAFFMVESAGRHRILQYIGRTTPKLQSGAKWNDLDAETVFDWK